MMAGPLVLDHDAIQPFRPIAVRTLEAIKLINEVQCALFEDQSPWDLNRVGT
jgi:hypothetical protein